MGWLWFLKSKKELKEKQEELIKANNKVDINKSNLKRTEYSSAQIPGSAALKQGINMARDKLKTSEKERVRAAQKLAKQQKKEEKKRLKMQKKEARRLKKHKSTKRDRLLRKKAPAVSARRRVTKRKTPKRVIRKPRTRRRAR